MPQIARLHIQARETDPIRVVELAGNSTRIGRAAFCDVRLPEATLSDEVCRIRFRSGVWQIVPIGPKGAVRIDGEILDQTRVLAFDVPFRVGSQWITLRANEDATPAVGHWSTHREDRIPAASSRATMEPQTTPIPVEAPGSELAARHRSEWDSQAFDHDRLTQNQRVATRWESRMKAVGEKLRASSVATATPAPPRVPISEPHKMPLRRVPTAQCPEVAPVRKLRFPKAGRDPIEKTSRRELPTLRTPKLPTSEVVGIGLEPLETPDAKVLTSRPESYVESDAFAREIEAISALSEQMRHDKCADVESITNESYFPEIDGKSVVSCASECWVHSADDAVAESRPTEWTLPESDPVTDDPEFVASECDEVLLERASLAINSEDEEDERDEEPRLGMRLGSARQVPDALMTVPVHPIIEPELVPEPEDWADPARFVTHSYQGDPAESTGHHLPIVHETSTHRENEPQYPFQPGGREAFGTSPDASSREWPSVNSLLAAQGVRSRPTSEDRPSRKTVSRPLPTDLKEPDTWSLPLWIGWMPFTAIVLLISAAGLFAGWGWARDDYNAGVIFARLTDESGKREPLPEGVAPMEGTWWRTNAANLVAWAAFNDLDRPSGSGMSSESRALLERASQLSPLDPTVRHALSLHTHDGEVTVPLARVLGQSRDVLTLSEAGRRLLAEGKQTEALQVYRDVLAMAAHSTLNHAKAPLFLDDPETARYGLPGEDRLRPIIREMAESKAWTYQDWSKTIPEESLAKVTTARVLRERGDPSAQLALDAALNEPESSEFLNPADAANRCAASAEALALQGKWDDARERYRQAIALTPIDVVRRAWWLNVAVFSLRLNEETERQKGLEAAKNSDPNDDVTQRVVEIQKKIGFNAQRTTTRVASDREANPPGPARK